MNSRSWLLFLTIVQVSFKTSHQVFTAIGGAVDERSTSHVLNLAGVAS